MIVSNIEMPILISQSTQIKNITLLFESPNNSLGDFK